MLTTIDVWTIVGFAIGIALLFFADWFFWEWLSEQSKQKRRFMAWLEDTDNDV